MMEGNPTSIHPQSKIFNIKIVFNVKRMNIKAYVKQLIIYKNHSYVPFLKYQTKISIFKNK